jgi:predicted dehydrogenase
MKTLKKAIKVGVVGCGYWDPKLDPHLRQLPDCQLKVIGDASEQPTGVPSSTWM